MAVIQDYYKLLGVSPKASEEEIKASYRKLAKQYHPDVHPGDAECERKFREINEAYGILGDGEKRKKYDAERKRAAQGKNPERQRQGTEYRGAENMDFSDLQRSFESFFGFRPDAGEMTDEKRGDSKKANPLDTTDLFERFMGIKR